MESESDTPDASPQDSTAVTTDNSRSSHLWSGVKADPHGKGRDSFGTAICVFKSGDAFGEGFRTLPTEEESHDSGT